MQMVEEHFRGQAQQRRLHREISRMGSESLHGSMHGGSAAGAALASLGSMDVTASTDDLAALSFAWASPELMPDSEVRHRNIAS